MQLVIPMSGFGERFRAAGYDTPKPLIEVDGKPIVGHVLDMFPGISSVVFICNEDHLSNPDYRMREILNSLCPNGKIVPIKAHKLGPVHAVLSALEHLDLASPVIVNYADFTCRWSFSDFERHVNENNLDAAVPAYRGFHPHSGGTTNYAYIRESKGKLLEIREKQPFTENKVEEFASSGTYYFKTGHLMEKFLRQQMLEKVTVGGEFYVSSGVNLIAEAGLSVGVYEIEHFMQWGTPQDLGEYVYWSNLFKQLAKFHKLSSAIKGIDYLGVLAGGLGARFQQVGYGKHKSLLEVYGRTIIELVSRASTQPANFLAVRGSEVAKEIRDNGHGALVEIDAVSDGQARSAALLVESARPKPKESITIAPSDTLFLDDLGMPDANSTQFPNGVLTVWVTKPTPFAVGRPENFGWIGDANGTIVTSLKKSPEFANARVITGAFTFSSLEVFEKLTSNLFDSGIKVNGEFYLDSLSEIADGLGIGVQLYEPKLSISLGTPYEFETFRYWQSCFDRWPTHPYSLELDPLIAANDIHSVRAELAATKHRPSEWGPVA